MIYTRRDSVTVTHEPSCKLWGLERAADHSATEAQRAIAARLLGRPGAV